MEKEYRAYNNSKFTIRSDDVREIPEVKRNKR